MAEEMQREIDQLRVELRQNTSALEEMFLSLCDSWTEIRECLWDLRDWDDILTARTNGQADGMKELRDKLYKTSNKLAIYMYKRYTKEKDEITIED